MDDDDPFGSLVRRCQPTSSQEDVLRTCPFARQSEVFPGDDDDDSPSSDPFGIPVDPTGIVMVSPPESSSPHEDFQTPPEDSLPASSEEQRPPAAAVDTETDRKFSGQAMDSLEFCGEKSTQLADGGVSGVDCSRDGGGVVASEVFASELEKCMAFQRKPNLVCDGSFESVPKKLEVADKHFRGFESPRAHEIARTEVFDLEVQEISEGMDVDKVFVELPLRETKVAVACSNGNEISNNSNRELLRKNIEDLDKFNYVSSRGANQSQNVTGVGGRRELPPSISGHPNNAGREAGPGTLAAKNKILKDLLDALKMVAGEVDGGSEEEFDFLETAKRRCMTFPRPRWWPPEAMMIKICVQ